MSDLIYYIDRQTGKKKVEKVYGEFFLRFLYGPTFFGRALGSFIARLPLFSHLFGLWQKLPFTKSKIVPFIKAYHINQNEFLDPVSSFHSFNAFFCRKLKSKARPIDQGGIIPADGRYLAFQNIDTVDGFIVKGQKFSLQTLLKDQALANEYAAGSLVIARLSPTDCHRFLFPADGKASQTKLVNGPLFSVNPMALKHNINILSENKRTITPIETDAFGKMLYIEIGATCVGSIHQTFTPNTPILKGEEKGYFSFGGSSILLLFRKNHIQLENDLLKNSANGIETLCLMGQPLGSAFSR